MRRKNWKKNFAIFLSICVLLMSGFSVSAADLQDFFDAEHYASQYEDLQKAFGNDEKLLWNHYLNYGLKEKREAFRLLNLAKYRENYADLDEAFGDEWEAYLRHYLTYGVKEGRRSFTDFDAAAYVERYPDLMEAFGYDAEALYRHWVKYGQAEKRLAMRVDPVQYAVNEPEQDIKISFDLNEEGFFSKAFCLKLDLDTPAKWKEGTDVFFPDSEEGKALLNQLERTGDLYEYGSMTFYPNGMAKWSIKYRDEAYAALSGNFLFSLLFPKSEVESEQPYTVDMDSRKITLTKANVELTFDVEGEKIVCPYFLEEEIYSIPGEVEGNVEGEIKFTRLSDVSYGEYADNTMDVFIPKSLDPSKKNGAFILIYGGAWTSGNNEATVDLAQQYAENGYVAAAINMRNCFFNEATNTTEVTVFDMLNDIQGSVRKLKSLSDENGWNITQCATKGFSSGGNLAMLYAYSRGVSDACFDTEEVLPVRFVADVVGPVDMHESAWYGDEEWPVEWKSLGGIAPGAGPLFTILLTGFINEMDEMSEEERNQYIATDPLPEDLEKCINSMSPVWYIDNGGGVPTVMGYSVNDVIQNPNNGKNLKGHLDGQNIQNDLYMFPNSIHGYSADPELAQEYFEKTLEYAQQFFITE